MPLPIFLLIDAGNTRVKWATATSRGSIRLQGDMATDATTLPRLRALAKKHPTAQVVVSSVVPGLIPLFKKAFPKRLEIVHGLSSYLGLTFNYPHPAELGADRLASAVAAHEDGQFPVIIVNCGTATAYTVLDSRGRLCGGAIAPGPQLQMASLASGTAQLPALDWSVAGRQPARSTAAAIRKGVYHSFLGGVNETLHRLAATQSNASILVTGGNARHLQDRIDIPVTLRPLLVFEGLRMIGLRAFAPSHESC